MVITYLIHALKQRVTIEQEGQPFQVIDILKLNLAC